MVGGVTGVGVSTKEKKGAQEIKPHFFTAIAFPASQLLKLKIPNKFAREHGKHLRDSVNLHVPNGKNWRVEITKSNGEIWLHKGWDLFAQYYSLALHNFLVFRFDIKTMEFQVLILDASTSLEINYGHNSDDGDDSVDESQQQSDEDNAKKRVEERVKAFHSQNPFFDVQIRERNLSRNRGPCIPASHCRKYFKENDGDSNNGITLRVDKNTWDLKYCRAKKRRFEISLQSGWTTFVLKNRLKEGDACVLELIHLAKRIYRVHIFRISDENQDDVRNETFARTEKRKRCVPKAVEERVHEKGKAFVGDGPGFIKRMNKSCIKLNRTVHIPLHHSKTYLKDEGNDRNVIVVKGEGGLTWKLKYQIEESYPRLSYREWSKYRSDNRLKIGDVCAFKLIDDKRKVYEVAIFRANGN